MMKEFLQRSYVRYGLVQSAITALCLVIMEITGQNESFDQKSPIFLLGTMLAPFVIWYFGIKERRKELKGKLTWKEGVKQGLKISLVYAIVSPFVFLIYYVLINPSIVTNVGEAYQLTNADNTIIITVDMLVQFVAALIFGGVYAAIISFFLKSKSK